MKYNAWKLRYQLSCGHRSQSVSPVSLPIQTSSGIFRGSFVVSLSQQLTCSRSHRSPACRGDWESNHPLVASSARMTAQPREVEVIELREFAVPDATQVTNGDHEGRAGSRGQTPRPVDYVLVHRGDAIESKREIFEEALGEIGLVIVHEQSVSL